MKYLVAFCAVVVLCQASLSAQVGPRPGRTSGRVVVPLEVPPRPSGPTPASVEVGAVFRCEGAGATLLVEDAPAGGETAYRGSEVDVKAAVEETPEPMYTEAARRYGTGGRVALRVTLGSEGLVSEVKVLRALPDGLTETAADAACRIRFTPARKDGREVSQYVTVTFDFESDDLRLPPPGSRRPAGVPPPGVRRFPQPYPYGYGYSYTRPWEVYTHPLRTYTTFPLGLGCLIPF